MDTPKSIALVLLVTCSIAISAIAQTAKAWPAADALFRADPQWLGSDAAFSIDLGNGRVLWMFNDTFVARRPGDDRRHSAFVHNSVAIQSGYDPSRANIQFYWRTKRSQPSEIFPSEGPVWMWPGSGIRIGNRLLLFCERVAKDSSKDSLGFKSVGWNAYWVDNPDGAPPAWKLKTAARITDTVIMASQALQDHGFVYLFGQGDPQNNLYLDRIGVPSFKHAKLAPLQWWSNTGWQGDQLKRTPLLHDAGTETSVQRDPRGAGFIEVNSRGFGASDIVMRRAPSPEGPWSAPTEIFRPPESDAADPFVYAGKSHAELQGADLILTYVTNGPDEKLARDMNLYFPRFARLDLQSNKP